MQPRQLIEIARELAAADRDDPGRTHLRRAVSSAYYAIFHALARSCADALIGATDADRHSAAWLRVYRSLEHGQAARQCGNKKVKDFSDAIQRFAAVFAAMQSKRHKADYDPRGEFDQGEVTIDINQAASEINAFEAAPLKSRQAFATFVLFKSREP